jgi:hypothetical protein
MMSVALGLALLIASVGLVMTLVWGDVDRRDAPWLASPFMPLIVAVVGGVGASLCLRAWLRQRRKPRHDDSDRPHEPIAELERAIADRQRELVALQREEQEESEFQS